MKKGKPLETEIKVREAETKKPYASKHFVIFNVFY